MRAVIAGKVLFLCLTALVPSAHGGGLAEQGAMNFRVTPQTIQVGPLYQGAELRVTADIPLSDGAIIKIEGESKELVLNRKGKLGIVWLNVARIRVENAPQVYILAASDVLTNVCSEQESRRLGLGFEAVRERLEFKSEGPLTGSEFEEFLKLKRHTGVYRADQSIDMEKTGEGRQRLSAVMSIPAAIPPGEYKVSLYYFRGGELEGEAVTSLLIEKVGLPLLMTHLAYEHAGLYGILAIVVAMVAGVVIGTIFGSRRGRAR